MQESLHGLVLGAAERGPSQPAIVWRGETLTYEALALRVERLAGQWHAAGLRAGDAVALVHPRGPDAIAAMYAASWLGCPFAPLEPSWPPARLAKAMTTLQARAWSCPERLRDALAGAACEAPPLWLSTTDEDPGACPAPVRGGSDPAYVLFTSGSTGSPKGVLHTHASALAFVRWAVKETALTAEDRLGGHASLSFDLSTFDVYGAAAAGAALHPVPESIRFRGKLLAGFMREERLTTWYSVPSVWPEVLDALEAEGAPIALRHILFAGEVFPLDQLRRLRRAAPEARLLNLYGPTETNVVTWHEIQAHDLEPGAPYPCIGRPCPGVTARVLDAQGQDAREGLLHVSGPTLMRGYLGSMPHVGPYATGDRVVLGEDGTYRFCGRNDRQVKVRGHRIELGDVESACATAPGVRDVVAIPINEAGRVTSLGVILTPGDAPVEEALARCRSLLPPFAVPTRVIALEQLPRTANGKLDRQLLATQLHRS